MLTQDWDTQDRDTQDRDTRDLQAFSSCISTYFSADHAANKPGGSLQASTAKSTSVFFLTA